MDPGTFERLAEFICGDGDDFPVYRSGSELTRFFGRVGINATHDGSTRKWWTLETLRNCNGPQLQNIIKRLASPHEYSGNRDTIRKALKKLNEILAIEQLGVKIKGLEPVLEKIKVDYNFEEDIKEDKELKPLPPPDFLSLALEPGIGDLLKHRWDEAQKCVDASAYLAAIIIMGSLLEGLLLAVMQRYPKEANQAPNAPCDKDTGKPKSFALWRLSDMINVAHELHWIDLDVKKFSHALRDFRNLIHPYEQLLTKADPDEDTCNISWLVVQAACNDLAKKL